MSPYQSVIRGRGSLARLPLLMEKLALRRPLIIGSSHLTGNLFRRVPALLSSPVFSAYHPNPDLADSAAAAALFLREGCDGLISLGGGSCMDTAKAVKARLNTPDEQALVAGRLEKRTPCPHIAVPGTAGTGAEATQFAVVYLDGRKLSLDHPSLRPDGVILDPSLLSSLPPYHRKSGALDALAQGIESYWSRGATEDSRVHAFLAVIGVLDNLRDYLAGDPRAASEMLDASFQSGKAIQLTRTTAAHAMSYRLTKTFGIAHGHACMLTLPTLWDMMLSRDENPADAPADNPADAPADNPIETLRDLAAKMRLGDPRLVPKLLRGILFDLEMGIPPLPDSRTLDDLTSSVDPRRLSNHPVSLSRQEIRRAYITSLTPLCENEKRACIDIWHYYGR